MKQHPFLIEKYRPSDRDEVRRIAVETAFLEAGPIEEIFDDPEILADALTSYYMDLEPMSCFVAKSGGRVVGYVIGAKNVRRVKRAMAFRIIPGLIIKAAARGVFFSKPAMRFLASLIGSIAKGEFYIPDFSGVYPATLHINVEAGFRSLGAGALLLKKYTEFLKGEGVRGVHFGTFSAKAKEFFIREGFQVLFTRRRSHLKYMTGQEPEYFVLGKKW
jgi:hypothetical protein